MSETRPRWDYRGFLWDLFQGFMVLAIVVALGVFSVVIVHTYKTVATIGDSLSQLNKRLDNVGTFVVENMDSRYRSYDAERDFAQRDKLIEEMSAKHTERIESLEKKMSGCCVHHDAFDSTDWTE